MKGMQGVQAVCGKEEEQGAAKQAIIGRCIWQLATANLSSAQLTVHWGGVILNGVGGCFSSF